MFDSRAFIVVAHAVRPAEGVAVLDPVDEEADDGEDDEEEDDDEEDDNVALHDARLD